MFSLRLRSLNALEQQWKDKRQKFYWQRYLGKRVPSADTIGYCFARIECEDLRQLLKELYSKLQRNHIISQLKINKKAVLVIDGHELNSSYKRCCKRCLERKIASKGGYRRQYYHRIVAGQLVNHKVAILLDVELQLPGEDEVEASRRLMIRLLKEYPKAFKVVSLDALYARANFINFLLRHNKEVVVVLKSNQNDLLEDMRGLSKIVKPKLVKREKARCYVWDIAGFRPEKIDKPLRLIRSYEIYADRISDWYWLTSLSKEEAEAEEIIQIGHLRWEIENQGFNELVNYYGLDHCFKHHPQAIIGFVLMCCISYLLFQVFYYLNLKHPLRRKYTLKQIVLFLIRDIDNLLFYYQGLLKPG
jgi:hypothetical protein